MLRYSTLVLAVSGMTALLGASGCEVKNCETADGKSAVCAASLTRFEADDIVLDPIAYAPGTDVTVHGNYGDIHVVEGAEGEVRVKLEPFNYRGHDEEAAARNELENNADYTFEENDSGIYVETERHDSKTGLGADITVYLPPEFDGRLSLVNSSDGPVNPGDIEADFVGAASSLELSTKSLGDCTVNGAPSVLDTRASCDGEIVVTNVSNGGAISSKGLGGSVRLVLAGLTDSAGGSVSTEDGDITLRFPEGGTFTVTALATEDGTVTAPALEEACAADIAAESSASFTCGDTQGDPHFTITAGTDGVGPSNISLSF
jgi:hypothetical protein